MYRYLSSALLLSWYDIHSSSPSNNGLIKSQNAVKTCQYLTIYSPSNTRQLIMFVHTVQTSTEPRKTKRAPFVFEMVSLVLF